jgi:PmbA protein
MIGAGQGNAMGGDFSGNVVLGYKVERGRITGRVKNTMVAGNVHTLLKQVGALGSDARWVGAGLYTGSILFPRVSVASADDLPTLPLAQHWEGGPGGEGAPTGEPCRSNGR